MNRIYSPASLLLLWLLAGCTKPAVVPQPQDRYGVWGNWALYETKRSTPTGFVVKPIDTGGPVQSVSFRPTGEFYSRGNDLGDFADFTHYQVDSTRVSGLQLGLRSGLTSDMLTGVGLQIGNHELTLRGSCAECYFKFKRIGSL